MSSGEEGEPEEMVLDDDEPEEEKPIEVQEQKVEVRASSFLDGEYLEPPISPKRARVPTAKDHITSRYLTKYEKARVLGVRALQISRNAPARVDLKPTETDSLVIAEKELTEKRMPFIVRRHLPDGSFEDWKLSDLIID